MTLTSTEATRKLYEEEATESSTLPTRSISRQTVEIPSSLMRDFQTGVQSAAGQQESAVEGRLTQNIISNPSQSFQ